MELNLKDKVVCITGSSRGIGRTIALAFAQEGARVVITGRHRVDVETCVAEAHEIGGNACAHGFVGDLQQEDNIRACIDNVVREWGRIDTLVANIGSGRGQPGWETNTAEWHRLLDINLLSGVKAAHATIPYLIRSERGSIVFIASIAGLQHLGAPAPYEAAKAALISHSKYLARTLAAHKIRVNVVAPGNILFPGSTWDDKLRSDNREAILAMIEAEVPMQRFGRPEEVADAVMFLASARASFITGACLIVDGGQTRAFA